MKQNFVDLTLLSQRPTRTNRRKQRLLMKISYWGN